jgi:hypothetical protein
MKLRGRTDAAHAEIREGLRKYGWLVLDASRLGGGAPDLIAATPGDRRIVLFEVKGKRTPTKATQQALLDLGWPIRIVHTLQEALRYA